MGEMRFSFTFNIFLCKKLNFLKEDFSFPFLEPRENIEKEKQL